MPSAELTQLKKLLISSGFEVYRTTGSALQLADRVRDNLIMDSNVRAQLEPLAVCFVTHAQRSEFAGLSEAQLFDKARLLGLVATEHGYSETERRVVEIHDPGDKSHILDLWYEISFRKAVDNLTDLVSELRFALSLEKAASASSIA